MCEATTIGLALTAVSAGVSATAAYNQGQTTKKIAENNAIMGEYAAQDAVRRGDQQADMIRRQGAQLMGKQRATMAANGLDLGDGTAAEIQDQTDFFTSSDVATARNNAKREAWALRAGAANTLAQGDAAATQGSLQAFSTILGTGGQVASKWYAPKKGP